MQKYIIDVSEHQGRIDWTTVKPHINGVIIRCGYGDDDTAQDDKYWTYNVAECERLKIPYGVYLYSYADSDAHIKSEIAHVKRLLKGHKPQYPVYIDLEESGNGSFAVKAANAFCPAITLAGYRAGVYTFESFYNEFMRGWAKYTLWVAKYGINDGAAHTKPQIGVNFDAWQFTSNARIGGYDGRLDASYFYRNFTDGEKKPDADKSSNGKVTDVLKIARSQLGVTNGRKYGAWYEKNIDKDIYNYDFGADGVPWCAMFVSWVFTQAKVSCAGLPGAYCPAMVTAAKYAGRVINVRDAVAGDVVYFDWDKDGESDHVGIVTANKTSYKLLTIEGNTDDGIVAEKERAYNTVCAVVRPYYGDAPKPVKKLDIGWRISCDKRGKTWLPHNNEGKRGSAMRWLAIANVEKYRVCTKENGWLPWVYKCNRYDLENGCAGDGSPITGVQVVDDDAAYAVRVLNRGWYPDMHGLTDTGGSGDNFAGDLANELDGFRIKRIY